MAKHRKSMHHEVKLLTAGAASLALASLAILPASAAGPLTGIASCSFASSSYNSTSADAITGLSVGYTMVATDANVANGYWIGAKWRTGGEDVSAISDFTGASLSGSVNAYPWDQYFVDTADYYVISIWAFDGLDKVGSPLCSTTVYYVGGSAGSKNFGHSDKSADPQDRSREAVSGVSPKGKKK